MDKMPKMKMTQEVIDMRRGVVLLITLSVIAAMLALVGVIFTYLDKSRENASYTAALIQADLLLRDSKDTIDALLQKGSKEKGLKKGILDTLYLAPVTMQAEEDEEIFVTLDCQPLDNGVNINWLRLENNSSEEAQILYQTAQSVFDHLVALHNLEDATLLLSGIKNAIEKNDKIAERLQGRLEQKKGIINLIQIQKIARNYRFLADDAGVEKIDWENYFSFDPESSTIDGNYLSAELIALLFEMELDAVKEEWIEGDDLKTFVSSHGGNMSQYQAKLFVADAVERMGCRINYGYQGNVYALGFDYLEGKAEKFEFYGKQ